MLNRWKKLEYRDAELTFIDLNLNICIYKLFVSILTDTIIFIDYHYCYTKCLQQTAGQRTNM